MSLWNTFRLLLNSAIVIAVGYTIRNFTHTQKSFPNGKQILTMAATKGNLFFQYSIKKKNRNTVIISALSMLVLVVFIYKLKQISDRRSLLNKEKEDESGSNLRPTKYDKKDVS